jgi:hypothetical protein
MLENFSVRQKKLKILAEAQKLCGLVEKVENFGRRSKTL